MKKREKPFNAVRMMREIRDRLSERCKEMTFEEQKQYMSQRLSGKTTKMQPGASCSYPLVPSGD
jgi:hypothetical protein